MPGFARPDKKAAFSNAPVASSCASWGFAQTLGAVAMHGGEKDDPRGHALRYGLCVPGVPSSSQTMMRGFMQRSAMAMPSALVQRA